jgi:Asp-tRNA(Asn)/Glu-tRNA(Gln) amidotransferase A subunit family amidase
MAGFDPRDSTSVDRPCEDYAAGLGDSLRACVIGCRGVLRTTAWIPPTRQPSRRRWKVLEAARRHVVEISLPNIGLSVPAYYVVAPAECSSNLSRFDGVRFGYRCGRAAGPRGPLQAQPRRGLRRRGEAAHHDRHLRAVGRLLRRLLPEGAAVRS